MLSKEVQDIKVAWDLGWRQDLMHHEPCYVLPAAAAPVDHQLFD